MWYLHKIFSFHKTIGFTSYAVKCHGVAIPKCAKDYPQSPEGTALYSIGCKSYENNAETFLERIFKKQMPHFLQPTRRDDIV